MEAHSDVTFWGRLSERLQNDPFVRERVIREIQAYINATEPDFLSQMNPGDGHSVDQGELNRFLTSQERNETRKLLLQYLIAFIDELPTREKTAGLPVDPFEQFKAFIEYNLNLLREGDVKKTILAELHARGRRGEADLQHRLQRINGMFSLIRQQVDQARTGSQSDFCLLLQALENLCILWFYIKDDDLFRIRRCDVYLFQLARILRGKYHCLD